MWIVSDGDFPEIVWSKNTQVPFGYTKLTDIDLEIKTVGGQRHVNPFDITKKYYIGLPTDIKMLKFVEEAKKLQEEDDIIERNKKAYAELKIAPEKRNEIFAKYNPIFKLSEIKANNGQYYVIDPFTGNLIKRTSLKYDEISKLITKLNTEAKFIPQLNTFEIVKPLGNFLTIKELTDAIENAINDVKDYTDMEDVNRILIKTRFDTRGYFTLDKGSTNWLRKDKDEKMNKDILTKQISVPILSDPKNLSLDIEDLIEERIPNIFVYKDSDNGFLFTGMENAKLIVNVVMKRKGGVRLTGLKSISLLRNIYDPPSSGKNNCVFDCLDLDAKEWRKKLGIPEGKMLSFDDVHRIDPNISIYTIVGGEIELSSGPEKSDKMILYSDKHYVRMNSKLLQFKSCKKCGRKVIDIEKHLSGCREKKCDKCGICYYEAPENAPEDYEEHNEQICEWFKNRKIKNTIRPTLQDKELIDDEYKWGADFEALLTEDGKFEIYAALIKNVKDPSIRCEFYGKDSIIRFCDFILSDEFNKKKNYIIFHNGSRFDTYFIVEQMLERSAAKIDLIEGNGAFKSVRLRNVVIWDLCLHLPGRLEKLCREYGCTIGKGDFDHSKIKSYADVDTYLPEIKIYLNRDVDSMIELFKKYETIAWNLTHNNVLKSITQSSFGFKHWTDTNKIPIILHSPEQDKMLRDACYGGKSMPQKLKFVSSGKDDELILIDWNSQYPTVMAKNKYPVGEWKEWNGELSRFFESIAKGQDEGGVWEISIIPNKKLLTNPVPRRDKNLKHDLVDISHGTYTNEDIRTMFKYGYDQSSLQIHKGLINEKMEYVFPDYINRIYEVKKSESGTKGAKYEVSKLMMNGLFGKQMQRNIMEQMAICSNIDEIESVLNKVKEIKNYTFVNDKFLIRYYEDHQDIKITKPTGIGSYILSYSRTLMNELIDSFNGFYDIDAMFYYTDTDSLLIKRKYWEKIKDRFEGKDLGQVSVDLDHIIEYYSPAPKLYIMKNTEGKEKVGAKGISLQLSMRLTTEDFRKMVEDKKGISEKELLSRPINANNTSYRKDKEYIDSHLKMDLSKFKKYGLFIRDFEQKNKKNKCSIYIEEIGRTILRTIWNGRKKLVGGKDGITMPFLRESEEPGDPEGSEES